MKISNIFRNKTITKNEIKNLIGWSFVNFGVTRTSYLSDKLKDLGFKYATDSGISISLEDLRVPPNKKNLIQTGNQYSKNFEIEYEQGKITKVERFQAIVGIWIEISELLKTRVVSYFKNTDSLNSIYIMSFSGARGNLTQVHQLVGMRGMMANPSGEIIEVPITSNFRDGLTITDYIISSYGARKGVVDTALRTADAGYLTRRLVDVAQDIIVRAKDCQTNQGIVVSSIIETSKSLISFKERIIGRTLAETIFINKNVFIEKNQIITPLLARYFENIGIKKVKIRSPLTCKLNRAVCKTCYGWNLAYNKTIGLGEAVGILAAQSIGEPGTQLTMQTFHTGGVFTAKKRQRLYAEFSGKVFFDLNLKVLKHRDSFGKITWIAQNFSYLQIRGFKNEQLKLKIKRGTIIEISHNEIITKGFPIANLPNTLDQDSGQEAIQPILSDLDGEIYINSKVLPLNKNPLKKKESIKNQDLLVWILSGKVHSIFEKSKILAQQLDFNSGLMSKLNPISKIDLINEYGGKIQLQRIGKQKTNLEIEICISPLTLNRSEVFLSRIFNDDLECILQSRTNKNFKLKNIKNLFLNQVIGESVNPDYFSPLGGFVNYLYDNDHANSEKSNEITTILFIPEETYILNKDINRLMVQDGDIVHPNTELIDNVFAQTFGIINLILKQNIIKEISIKCGKIVQLVSNLIQLDQQIFFPGELILNQIEVNELTYTEVLTLGETKILLLRPIIRYDIPLQQNEIKEFSNSIERSINFPISFETISNFPHENKKLIKSSDSINIKSTFLIIKTKLQKINQTKIQIRFIRVNKKLVFEINFSERFSFTELISPELKDENLTISTYFENNQLIEPYTCIASIYIIGKNTSKLKNIKDKIQQGSRQLLLIRNEDFTKFFFEKNQVSFLSKNIGEFITVGTNLKKNIRTHLSGQITKINSNNLELRKAKAYLFSKGAIIYQFHEAFVKKGNILGLLTYRRARTDDIVQGLPRVESILEARSFKNSTILTKQVGIISKIYQAEENSNIYIRGKTGIIESLNTDELPIIRKNQFVFTGSPLSQQPVNGQNLLDTQFRYFRDYLVLDEAIFRTFGQIQLFLLTCVQSVYRSQGVEISDKHIEVILKKMTSKVQIINPSYTSLLPNEFISFGQAKTVNKILAQLSFQKLSYIPVLLGITKASLKTESFLAAASFQDTTRILTESAIEGKIDWLFGIKESVIAGKMIPVGTGFGEYMRNQNLLNLNKLKNLPEYNINKF